MREGWPMECRPYVHRACSFAGNIRDGWGSMPVFQRGLVWTPEQCVELWRSVAAGYPMGTILVWGSEPRGRELDLIVDGQQRLSTLAGIGLRSEAVHPVAFDAGTGEFRAGEPEGELEVPAWQALDWLKWALDVGDKALRHPHWDAVREHVHNSGPKDQRDGAPLPIQFGDRYELVIHTLVRATAEEVVRVFELLNMAGTPIHQTELEALLAQDSDLHLDPLRRPAL